MKKLLKDYEFSSDQEYYQYIVDSYFNGQPQQAASLFLAMPRVNRKEMVKEITVEDWNSGLGNHKIKNLIDLI